jgi:hypothetical protein
MESYGETVRFRLENLISNVKNIRNKKELIDVTLVGDDGIQIGAHMIMLSACSTFFRNIFVNMKHKHPLLYLRGMKSLNISAVLDFIYQGEVQVLQEHLQNFLDMAEDLGIQGLTNLKSAPPTKVKATGMKQREEKLEDATKEIPTNDTSDDKGDLPFIIEDFVDEFTNREMVKYESLSMEEVEAPAYNHEEIVVHEDIFSDGNDALIQSLDKQIEEIIQQVGDGYWGCKKCGKVMRKKQHIKNHAESHLIGYSHPCQYCGKHSKTRNALTNHISYFHRKPFPGGSLMLL